MSANVVLIGLGLLLIAGCSTETTRQGASSDAGGDAPSCPSVGCSDAGAPTADAGDSIRMDATEPGLFLSESGDGFIRSLRIAGGFLYWIGPGNRIVRSPVAAAASSTLFTHPNGKDRTALWELAVDDTGIYFSDEDIAQRRGIYSMPLDGSKAPLMLASAPPQDPPLSIAVAGDDICYVQGVELRHIKKAGGVPTVMARGGSSNDFRQLVIAGGYVYFQAELGNEAQDVYRLPLTAAADAGGPAPEKISPVPGRFIVFMSEQADRGDIYWTASDSFFRWSAATRQAVAVGSAEDVQSLAAYDGTLYFSTFPVFSGSNTLSKLAVPDGPSQVIASVSVGSVAVDAQYVFVTSQLKIYRFAR